MKSEIRGRVLRIASLISLSFAVAAGGTAFQVKAADSLGVDPFVHDPTYLSFGAGYFDVFDDFDAAEFRVEYHSDLQFWIFKPFAGIMVTSDASVFGYGGVLTDFHVGPRWVISPSIAGGLYEEGDGKDLGHVVEFRSAIEVAYQFDDRSRLGVLFYHISNAGLDDDHAGTEVLGLNYSLPID